MPNQPAESSILAKAATGATFAARAGDRDPDLLIIEARDAVAASSDSACCARAGDIHRFRLFVAGDAHNAAVALANLTAYCHVHLVGRHAIEVVDVFRESGRALADGISVTPTLIRVSPLPTRRIIGTLDDEGALARALGLAAATR